jgi:3-methyladenine DNA glycosylase AlkD
MTTRYLDALQAQADPERARQMRAYHKLDRPYLGLANAQIDNLAKHWRRTLPLSDQIDVADDLWQTDIYEARLAAAKLLTQNRIGPDDTKVWQLIASWTPDFDSWAIADHACMAGQKRLLADPQRIDEVETWITSPHMWTRRAALVSTLPWTRQRQPTAAEQTIRQRVLGWAETYVPDAEWFIQKAIAWWLRELSKRDPQSTINFIKKHGDQMKPFSRKEAFRHLIRTGQT